MIERGKGVLKRGAIYLFTNKKKMSVAGGVRATRRAVLSSFPAAFKPQQQVNGRWWKPAYSARKMARFRKEAHESGNVLHSRMTRASGATAALDRGARGKKSSGWNAAAPVWDTAWDRPVQNTAMPKPKGHLRDRTRGKRFEKIAESLEKMPETVAEFRKELHDRKPLKTLRADLKMD